MSDVSSRSRRRRRRANRYADRGGVESPTMRMALRSLQEATRVMDRCLQQRGGAGQGEDRPRRSPRRTGRSRSRGRRRSRASPDTKGRRNEPQEARQRPLSKPETRREYNIALGAERGRGRSRARPPPTMAPSRKSASAHPSLNAHHHLN